MKSMQVYERDLMLDARIDAQYGYEWSSDNNEDLTVMNSFSVRVSVTLNSM